MILKLGMQHRELQYCQVYSSDAPGLTLTYFTARSNLFPYAFVWEKFKTMDFSETVVVNEVCSYSQIVNTCTCSFMSTKGQGPSLTLVQITQIQYF